MTATGKPASLAGVVLAAGASPWQGRAKALKQIRDGHTTAVEHVVSVVAERCQPVFVVTSPGQSVPELPAEVVRDDVRGHGQLSAVGRGLRAAAEAGEKYAFVCSVDAELLDPDVIDVLVARAAAVDADIVLPWDGTNHYLAAVYRTELAAVVDDLVAAGERGISALIARVDSQRVVISDADSHSLSHA
ncbi:molybdenum cofactor guanylyltransferase [Mycobacterium sp. 1245111.1]|uniref:molybdenum cofactor guanylyltransferase n=1 Tax=Mycobacterium sp. 1245111.1 TaxID=1834073 RepID=UPI0008024B59|nr:molybdenum cofactor guanylyltransferase [Mycobacterium sp. 1245111.1]OBK33515.1 molybdenum cofactor guanylyltransferase [Mycobacterium sp. 1245111.1]